MIEKCGGQMTNDGSRRRTPGGVLWNILSNRVGPVIYKEIMTRGNERVVRILSCGAFVSCTWIRVPVKGKPGNRKKQGRRADIKIDLLKHVMTL